jgi:hypothetical protein
MRFEIWFLTDLRRVAKQKIEFQNMFVNWMTSFIVFNCSTNIKQILEEIQFFIRKLLTFFSIQEKMLETEASSIEIDELSRDSVLFHHLSLHQPDLIEEPTFSICLACYFRGNNDPEAGPNRSQR